MDRIERNEAIKHVTMDKSRSKRQMLSLEGPSKAPAKSTSTTLLMLGSTESNRSKAMSRPRPKSLVLEAQTIPSTITPISWPS